MTEQECIHAMKKKLPVIIDGSYLFHSTPTVITSVGWMSCRVEGSTDHYEHHRIKLMENHNQVLLQLGAELHPHLGDDNHTNRLLRKLFETPNEITIQEAFDLGKYYSRMSQLIGPMKLEEFQERNSALTELKAMINRITYQPLNH